METQSDQNIRVVSLSNLRAMCARVSGECHRFSIVKVSRSRVHVEYSNPDEYGSKHPMIAVFPATPGFLSSDDRDNPRVILDPLRVMYDDGDGEGWQAFQLLLGCPTLWRDPKSDSWYSHADFERDGGSPIETGLPDNCTVCDLPVAYEARCHACGGSVATRTADRLEIDHIAANHKCPVNNLKPDIIVRAITRAEVQS